MAAIFESEIFRTLALLGLLALLAAGLNWLANRRKPEEGNGSFSTYYSGDSDGGGGDGGGD
jgi:hypothetical protein